MFCQAFRRVSQPVGRHGSGGYPIPPHPRRYQLLFKRRQCVFRHICACASVSKNLFEHNCLLFGNNSIYEMFRVNCSFHNGRNRLCCHRAYLPRQTDFSMAPAGGICFMLLHALFVLRPMPLAAKCIAGTVLVTALEFCSGGLSTFGSAVPYGIIPT